MEGGLSSLSHAHTCTEIFQNTLGNLHSIQSVCTDREGIKEREDGEKGWGGGGNYLRDGYYSRKYGTCLDGEQEIGL